MCNCKLDSQRCLNSNMRWERSAELNVQYPPQRLESSAGCPHKAQAGAVIGQARRGSQGASMDNRTEPQLVEYRLNKQQRNSYRRQLKQPSFIQALPWFYGGWFDWFPNFHSLLDRRCNGTYQSKEVLPPFSEYQDPKGNSLVVKRQGCETTHLDARNSSSGQKQLSVILQLSKTELREWECL